jgi:arylsulfatase A-like enzyme
MKQLLVCFLSLASLLFGGMDELPAQENPNFVVVLVDDLGWMDLGCYGSKYYETPNIDRLSASGIKFTNGYAACAVCSPTRAAMMTGRYPARVGITDWIRARFQGGAIPADGKNPSGYAGGKRKLLTPRNPLWMELAEVTLAEALKPAGYVSCHIGKWHLGPNAWYPEKQGFNVNIGGCDYGQPPRYHFPYETKRQPKMPLLDSGEPGEYLTDREGIEAVKFIEQNKDKPFFLYLAHYAVHTPIQAKQELKAKYDAKPKAGQINAAYAAMIESVDDAVGRVLNKLDELKLTEKTVVIFTSDNGGLSSVTNNAPLRAGKGHPYEGGIRVPYIVRWPGVTKAGSQCQTPISTVDIFPTVLDMADVPLPKHDIDGVSLVDILDGENGLKRDGIYWHFPHYRGGIKPYGIVRAGDYKLLRYYESGDTELYNLKTDLSEANDLAASMPDKVKQLDVMLSKWLIGVGAKIPMPNPAAPTK